MNRPIFINKIVSTVNLPKHRASDQDGFTGDFYHILEEKITTNLYILFQKIEAEEISPNSFYEANITLVTNPERDNLD